jgi:hypothetical protein
MRTEKTFWIVFLVAFILRLLNIPSHGALTVLSMTVLSLIYFPGGFYFFSDKKIMTQKIGLSIPAGFVLAVIPLAIMFKLQHYPGYFLLAIIGIIGGPILFVLTKILQRKSDTTLHKYYRMMNLRLIVLTLTMVLFFLLPSKTIINIQYRNDPEQARLRNLLIENPSNYQYQQELQKHIYTKDSLNINEQNKNYKK